MSGKVCMVTGAASGIGRATALGLARLGARVMMVDRERGPAERARSDMERIGGKDSVDLMILDDEPVVSLSVPVHQTVEDTGAPGEIVVSRTGDPSSSLDIVLDFSASTAQDTVDYTLDAPVPVVTIPAGSTSRTIHVTPIPDPFLEVGGELVAAELQSSPDYRLGASRSVAVTIVDDD